MAGDWLKFDCNLPEKPETLALTVAMGWDDPDLTVGKLMRLFRWFDQHTLKGNAPNVTAALLDRIVGVTGFVTAVADVGWLVIDESGISLHNFEKHNGATAKSRLLTAKRVANCKANALGNARSVSDALPREEKRREEKRNTNTATGVATPDGVSESVWSDFKKLRAAKKAAITKTAIDGIKREADTAGMTLGDALAMCCERGWTGFKAEWASQQTAGGSINKQEALEARNRAVGQRWADGAVMAGAI